METAITRERMIKMKTSPAVLNQLLLSNASTQHPSLVTSLPQYRIIQKHASKKIYIGIKSKTNPKFVRGVVLAF